MRPTVKNEYQTNEKLLNKKLMNISWLGTRNDDQDADPIFGRKFLGVKAGGSLEVHGPYKKSWTKLNETLVPRPSAFALSPLDSSPPKGNLNIFVIRIPQ